MNSQITLSNYRFDCAVDPEAIGNLRFSEEELYQRTFAMERKFKGNPSAVPQRNGAHVEEHASKKKFVTKPKQRRRRGAEGVMKLRNLTSNFVIREAKKSPRKQEETIRSVLSSPARRSHRSTTASSTPLKIGSPEANGQAVETLTESALSALEDRILLRSLESYGPNYDFIQENSIPVHGDTSRDNSQTRVRNRCLQLARASKAGKPARPKNLKTWTASTIAIPLVSANQKLGASEKMRKR
jgi:hypothetical protein